jgi:serine/threonine protein kinase
MSDSYNIQNLVNAHQFCKYFVRKSILGAGGDGTVYAYENKKSGQLVAVKMPNAFASSRSSRHLSNEIHNFKALGHHPHIVSMLAYQFQGHPPMIFLEKCALGDLNNYRYLLLRRQLDQSSPTSRVPENTVWKLFKDMTLALNYMHNNKSHANGYTHNDLKPGNILVKYPTDWNSNDGIPSEPVFQLTDFSRMKPYPGVTANVRNVGFIGTPEYAPPPSEQTTTQPSGDVWSLGATLQSMALGVLPIQSRESFIAERKKQGKKHPRLGDEGEWEKSLWRDLLPTVFRPLSASRTELEEKYDFQDSLKILVLERNGAYRPYSRSLDGWYSALWNKTQEERITADVLFRYQVPAVEAEMDIARDIEAARLCLDRARKLRRDVRMRQS